MRFFAAALLSATTLPYLIGFASQGEAWRFTGFVFGVEDGNSYLAKMLRGSAGDWLFRSPYSAAPQRGVLAYLPYLLLGKLAAGAAAHEQLTALFHLFRLGAGFLAIRATYDFLALFVAEIRLRRLGLLLASAGGGLGWIFALPGRPDWPGSLPLEFYSPEAFGFLALYGLPHLALARALALWGLVAYLKAAGEPVRQAGLRRGWRIGRLWLLAGLAHPLAGVTLLAVVGAYLLALAGWQSYRRARRQEVDWTRWRGVLLLASAAGFLSALLALYDFLAARLAGAERVAFPGAGSLRAGCRRPGRWRCPR